MHTRVIWWVKRDARLYDNEALYQAAQAGMEVIPLYVIEPLVYEGLDWSSKHTTVYHEALSSLDKNLRHHGSALFVRTGEMIAVLEELMSQLPFSAIYAHEETGLNHTFARDIAVNRWCTKRGVRFVEVPTNGVVRGLKNRDVWQQQFVSAMTAPVLPIPKNITLDQSIKKCSGRLPEHNTHTSWKLQTVSERTAHETLRDFLNTRGVRYSGGVSSMLHAPTACSRLSVHLAWGTLSLKTVFQVTSKKIAQLPPGSAGAKWRRSLRAFQSRLFWHSHFIQRLEDAVYMETKPLNNAFLDALPVVAGEVLTERLEAWRTGMTGFPAIDAAMRCYAATGWLNFRSRAMITSFAVHALRIPWTVIVYELAKLMSDYVPGIHVSQVQMQTGITGFNTIRVYSPHKQQQDHDPSCVFIKRWIPELASYTATEISQFDTRSLTPYIAPIIDFKAETKIMKDALYGVKKSVEGSAAAQIAYRKHGSRKSS